MKEWNSGNQGSDTKTVDIESWNIGRYIRIELLTGRNGGNDPGQFTEIGIVGYELD